MAEHALLGKTVRWEHGPNVLVGPATHYEADDDELFIVPDGLMHGHYWVPAHECIEEPTETCPVCQGTGGVYGKDWHPCGYCSGRGRIVPVAQEAP